MQDPPRTPPVEPDGKGICNQKEVVSFGAKFNLRIGVVFFARLAKNS